MLLVLEVHNLNVCHIFHCAFSVHNSGCHFRMHFSLEHGNLPMGYDVAHLHQFNGIMGRWMWEMGPPIPVSLCCIVLNVVISVTLSLSNTPIIILGALRTSWLVRAGRPGTPGPGRFIRPMISTAEFLRHRPGCCAPRTPWLPGRSAPSTARRCARARPRCGRTVPGRAH